MAVSDDLDIIDEIMELERMRANRLKRAPFQPLNAAPLPSPLWFVEGWVVMGNTETLIVVPPDGRTIDLHVPAMRPYDEVQMEWPRTELYFVGMFGVVHAVMADTFRHACKAIEEVYEVPLGAPKA